MLDERNECLSRAECQQFAGIPFEKKCRNRCPPHYDPANNNSTCIPCTDCKSIDCGYRQIETHSAIPEFKECHNYHGDLVIQLLFAAPNTMELLTQNLANLRVINGSLKIHRSPAITSLSFLKNLHTITGASLYPGNFSLIISENENLQSLWHLTDGNKIHIKAGNAVIVKNSNLCLSEIHQFQNGIAQRPNHDIIDNYSNGFAHACKSISINVVAKVLTPWEVLFEWTPFEVPDSQRVIAYFIVYIEAPEKNASYTNSNTCTK